MKKYYREFTCIECGAKAIDRGSRQDAKFCSTNCNSKNYKREQRKIARMNKCKYNEWVLCDVESCENCGWNPKVQQARVEKLEELEYGKK